MLNIRPALVPQKKVRPSRHSYEASQVSTAQAGRSNLTFNLCLRGGTRLRLVGRGSLFDWRVLDQSRPGRRLRKVYRSVRSRPPGCCLNGKPEGTPPVLGNVWNAKGSIGKIG